MSLLEFLVLVIALASLIAAAAHVRLSLQISRTASEVERVMHVLLPKFEEVLEDASLELDEFRRLTGRLGQIADHVETVSGEASRAAVPLIREIEKLRRSKRYLEAAAAGVRKGLETWRERTSPSSSERLSEGV
ncbi:MAG: hypothetical protein EHM19_03100 [Candidatus Latescibacterota bacterium]|nr:MAG: hypothetical protein EHM19_03100 [Candidatus Latescibacterota bacterium]